MLELLELDAAVQMLAKLAESKWICGGRERIGVCGWRKISSPVPIRAAGLVAEGRQARRWSDRWDAGAMLLENAHDRAAGNFVRAQRAIQFFFFDGAQDRFFIERARRAESWSRLAIPRTSIEKASHPRGAC